MLQPWVHMLPERRVADGVAPVDEFLLETIVEALQPRRYFRERQGPVQRAGQRVIELVIGDAVRMPQYAPLRCAVSCGFA